MKVTTVKKLSYFPLLKLSQGGWKLIRLIILLGVSYYILYPMLLKLSLALMEKGDMYDTTVQLVPRNFTFKNFIRIFKELNYTTAAFNSLWVVILTSFSQLTSCVLTGYGFARFKFFGKRLMFAFVILTLIVPPQTIIIPMFLNYRFFDPFGLFTLLTGKPQSLINTPITLILSGLTCMGLKNGLYIFISRQYFRNVPRELEDAALIDGAGFFGTFLRIMLPSSRPILLVIFLFSSVWQWVDIFYTGWFMPKAAMLSGQLDSLATNIMSKESAAQGVSSLDSSYISQINATGCLLVILPLLVLYLLMQRQFVESVERTGIVG